VIALTADLTRDTVRTRAMAAIGMTIGATFAVSLIAGPALTSVIGVPGVFAMTGVLALLAMLVLRASVPQPDLHERPALERGQWLRVLADPDLLRLNYGIFALHASLMALFVQVPFMLRDGGIAPARHWLVYLPVLVASVVLMLPAMMRSDSATRAKRIFIGAVAVVFAGQVLLALPGHGLPVTIGALVVFFTGFNLLEATLPSLISKFAPAGVKGTAVGVYSSVQFLGTFVGGACGGWLSQRHGPGAVFAFCLVLTGLWFAVAFTMSAPPTLERVAQ
jgi:predicted MFS family arabinose efflux permease